MTAYERLRDATLNVFTILAFIIGVAMLALFTVGAWALGVMQIMKWMFQ